MTETETKWSERVRQWRSSGQTGQALATGREFRWTTLRYWASRLRHQPGPISLEVKAARPVRMARVVRTPPKPSDSSVVVRVGAAEVLGRPGFDGALLRAVVEALGTSS